MRTNLIQLFCRTIYIFTPNLQIEIKESPKKKKRERRNEKNDPQYLLFVNLKMYHFISRLSFHLKNDQKFERGLNFVKLRNCKMNQNGENRL